MASNNNAIVVNYTNKSGSFSINGQTAVSLANGEETLVENFAPAGDALGTVKFSGPMGAGSASLTVSGGTNSWTTFVFTDNGFCNVFPSPNADNVRLS